MSKRNFNSILDKLISTGIVIPFSSKSGGEYFCTLQSADGTRSTLSLYSKELSIGLKARILEEEGVFINNQDINELIERLEVEAYKNRTEMALVKRVYNADNEQILYDLGGNKVVVIENGEVYIDEMDEMIFRRTSNFKEQVLPDLNYKPKHLLKLIKKHYNFATADELILFSIYLVSCYIGLEMNHPVLVLYGSKGSGKSYALKCLESLVEPKQGELSGMQTNISELQLKLFSNYFVGLDNLSKLPRSYSDTLCQASTGGSTNRRRLYSNDDMITWDIKSIVALNSVSEIIQESDLLDRSLLLKLKRISPTKIRTEEELKKEFELDVPKILGACFNTLAEALKTETELDEGTKLIRLADFHKLAISIGCVLGIPQSRVDKILWNNQRRINQETIYADVVASTFIEFMKEREYYKGSVSDLLQELIGVAKQCGIHESLLPKAPNVLSKKLNKVKSNLEEYTHISYTITNIGTYRQIIITKK